MEHLRNVIFDREFSRVEGKSFAADGLFCACHEGDLPRRLQIQTENIFPVVRAEFGRVDKRCVEVCFGAEFAAIEKIQFDDGLAVRVKIFNLVSVRLRSCRAHSEENRNGHQARSENFFGNHLH